MTNRVKNVLRIISILIVLLAVLMELNILTINLFHTFWFTVIAFAILLFTIKR